MSWITNFTSIFSRSTSGTINPAQWLIDLFGGTETRAGEAVNGMTALQSQAVYACVTLISDTISTLPWHLKQDENVLSNTPTDRIISRAPNHLMNAIDFRRGLINNMLQYGNGYALPVRRGSSLSALMLIPAQNVTIDNSNGELIYSILLADKKLQVTADQIIHIKAYTIDGVNGSSPITYARETIGTNIAATNHMGNFYGKGAQPKGFISIKGTMRDTTKKTQLGEDFDAKYGASQSGKTAVLTEGAEYIPLTTTQKDAQFIESQEWTVEEIARCFKVPPHKIGRIISGTQTQSIEAQNHQFVQDCIRPIIELLELEFTNKLVNQRNQYIEIDFSALLRGDTATQVSRDVSYWNIGVLNANEIRESNGLPPRDGGDEYFNPLAMSNNNDLNNGKEDRPDLANNDGGTNGNEENEN